MSCPIDRLSIDQLVVEHLPVALRLAQRLTNDPDAAEDVVQEALCRVLKCWKSYRGDATFSTWMMQIVVNVDRDRRRRWRKTDELPHELRVAGASAASEQAEMAELHETIRAVINRLPDRQREVALLSLGEGLDAREIAYILETTEANVHTCVHLARRRIADAIGIEYVRRK
jgi:RNA polymerase sigma-70 factor (ECF subfamily)